MNTENNVCVMEETEPIYEGFEMRKKDRIFSIFTAIICIPFVSLTLWGGFNIGYTISVFSFLIFFGAYLFNRNVKFKVFPYLCLVLSLCSSAVFTFSSDLVIRFFLFLLLTLTGFIWLVYLGGYDIADDYSLVSAVFIGIFGSAFGSVGRSLKSVFSTEVKKERGFTKILMGVACAIPSVIILILLLRSSDAAFDGLLSKIGKYIGDLNGVILKIIAGALLFPFAVSLGLGLAKNKREQGQWKISGEIEKVLVASFLSTISVVYVIYIFSQFAYFFNAFKGLLPDDITPASYARRGFFEMTIIAAINFVIISVASIVTKKKENGKRAAFVNALIVFIAVFTLLLIATALAKMILYIDIFGMTRLRILTSAFMVFLALLFIAVILRVYIKKIPVVKTGIVAATVILLIIGFADVDKTVARYNLYAFEQGYTKSLDVEAIGDLGWGAVPTLYEIYEDKKYSEELRSTASAELYQKVDEMYELETVYGIEKYESGIEKYKSKKEVGSFNISEHRAQKILEDFLGI